MKSNIDDSLRLFRVLIILLSMNCIWVTITTVIHGVVSLEGIFSAYRLLVSVLLAYAIHHRLTLPKIAHGLFWAATINSVLIAVQLFDALSDRAYLPLWLKYGWIYGVEDIELWRKGGLFPSLQTSSLLAVYGIFFGAWQSSRKVMFLVFPFLAIALLLGARTFLPVGLVGIGYMVIRMPLVTGAWLGALAWNLISVDGFWEFFQLRFGGLLDVFLRFDFASDYSAVDTMQSYREFSVVEFFVGNGKDRYSDEGGNDPFYTRWLFQAGVPSVILLLAVLAAIGGYCGRYSVIAYVVLAVACYHNIKGELFTSAGTYDVLVLIAFVFLRQRGGRAAAFAQHKSNRMGPQISRNVASIAA
jgi:hypothetical protein